MASNITTVFLFSLSKFVIMVIITQWEQEKLFLNCISTCCSTVVYRRLFSWLSALKVIFFSFPKASCNIFALNSTTCQCCLLSINKDALMRLCLQFRFQIQKIWGIATLCNHLYFIRIGDVNSGEPLGNLRDVRSIVVRVLGPPPGGTWFIRTAC